MKKVILIFTILIISFSCKKEEKANESIVLENKPVLANSISKEVFLGTWLPLSVEDSDWDSIEIDQTKLHLNYPMGEAVIKYDIQSNEMILTYDYSDTKINLNCDDCHLKKVGKFYIDNQHHLVLEINSKGAKCGVIYDGKFTFVRAVSAPIEAVEVAQDTHIDFDTFSATIPDFESEIDATEKNLPKNTICLKDNSDGWGLSNKKVQISSLDKSLKFEIEYCFTETLVAQLDGSIVWKGNSTYQKAIQIDNTNFMLKEISKEFYGKCKKELQETLKLKDTMVEIDYSIADLLYDGKPVLFEPKFIILKFTATNPSGLKTIRFVKVEIYEGGC
jgi:hypothetical protein